MKFTKDLLQKIKARRTARDASWILVGQCLNFALQAFYFILLARLIGVTEYGIFSGSVALVNTLAPYSTLGAGLLFIRYVTRDPAKAGLFWGNALAITATSSIIIAAVASLVGPTLTNIHRSSLFCILAFANCLFLQIPSLACQVYQTYGKLRVTAILTFSTNLARFVVLVLMILIMHHANAIQWAIGVLIGSILAALLSIITVSKTIGPIRFDLRTIKQHSAEGLGFSFAANTQAIYNDIDKTMLTRYGLNRENGFYTLAARIAEIGCSPVVALDNAILPRHFGLGRERMTEIVRLVFKSVRAALLIGVVIALCLTISAPLIPHLVGRDFSGVVAAIRWLCWVPFLRGVHRLTGIALTGTGYQWLRTTAQLFVTGLNIGLNLWWIPSYGWIGAAWSTLLTELALGLLNSVSLFWVWRSQSGALGAVPIAKAPPCNS